MKTRKKEDPGSGHKNITALRPAAGLTRTWLLALAGATLATAPAPAAEPEDFGGLDLDQLANIKIVTAARREQAVRNIPAAVDVVTHDDIRRSGATSIPEALRNVPGLNVAQINGSAWGIGARGFPWQYAPRLLVLMDGRSVYTPAFGGVFWDVQDYLLDDLDRIEVVLGPGSTVWGANAMNGVINVISKSARDTQGSLVYAGGGSEKIAMAGAREGFRRGKDSYARVYAKYHYNGSNELPDGSSADDAFQFGQAGFRMDGYRGDRAHWTLQGDGYGGWEESHLVLPDPSAPPDYYTTNNQPGRVSGANILGRWEQKLGEPSTLVLQAYYDYASRDTSLLRVDVHTLDLEARYTLVLGDRNKLDLGVDYRLVADRWGEAQYEVDPPSRTTQLFGSYLQDEWWIIRDTLSLTAGLKLEQNTYTGWEPQPGARLLWHPHPAHTLWAGYSRAVRLPSRADEDGDGDAAVLPGPAILRVMGSDGVQPETLNAYEGGWRWQVGRRANLEARGFYYDYDDLVMISPVSTNFLTVPPELVAAYNNGLSGRSYGGEAMLSFLPVDRWRLRLSYSYVKILLNTSREDPFDYVGDEFTTPRNTVAVQSSLSLARHWDLDAALRYVDEIPFYAISDYLELDARLSWRPNDRWELALVGQNLLHARHAEYKPALVGNLTEIKRGVYGRVTCRF